MVLPLRDIKMKNKKGTLLTSLFDIVSEEYTQTQKNVLISQTVEYDKTWFCLLI